MVKAQMPLNNPHYDRVKSIHEFKVRNIKGEVVNLDTYAGHVCIVLNFGSKSGFTLFNLHVLKYVYKKFGSQGLRILAFPCNQFNQEEPGTAEDIIQFAEENKTNFDIFEKSEVNGPNANTLWKFLKSKVDIKKPAVITTNYTKFLVNKAGVPFARFGPDAEEATLIKALEPYFSA